MNVAHHVARKLFDDDKNDKNITCPIDPSSLPEAMIKPIIGNLKFHDFATILSGACGVASLIIISAAIIRHAINFSNPIQQRQVIRILLLVPWVALFCFLIVWQEDSGEYLVPALDFGCSIAISSFLLLLCDFILSNPGGFEELFGPGATKGAPVAMNSPPWFKVCPFTQPSTSSGTQTNTSYSEPGISSCNTSPSASSSGSRPPPAWLQAPTAAPATTCISHTSGSP